MLTTQSLLRCPQCHAQISVDETRASCVNHHEYAVDSGIVAFLRELSADTHIRPLDHCCEAGGVDYRTDHYILPWMRRHAPGGNLAGLKVLEDGAGGGQQVRRYVDEGLDAYGIDPGSRSQQWKSLDLDGRMFIADGCDLPFEDESFDFVTSSGVLEHVGEPRPLPQRDPYQGEYIREILRVLKPGGMALMAQPNGANPRTVRTQSTSGIRSAGPRVSTSLTRSGCPTSTRFGGGSRPHRLSMRSGSFLRTGISRLNGCAPTGTDGCSPMRCRACSRSHQWFRGSHERGSTRGWSLRSPDHRVAELQRARSARRRGAVPHETVNPIVLTELT